MNTPLHKEKSVFYRQFNLRPLTQLCYALLLTGLLCQVAQAQDIHYSQFYNSPLNISPGLTGIFQGNTRLMANYRTQWRAVPVDYLTFTGSVDTKFVPRGDQNGFFSAGLLFNYDEAGLSKLQQLQLGLNGSYTQKLSDYSYLTLGLRLDGNQRSFDVDALSFDEQFDKGRGQFDPEFSNQESFLNDNNTFFGVGAGVNFRIQGLSSSELVDDYTKRSKLDLGVGLFHINRPNQSFYDGYKARLFMRISPYAAGALMLSRRFDVVGNFTAQFQGPYTEMLGMAGVKYHLDPQLGNQMALQLGVGYRFDKISDAYYPTFEFFYNSWQVGLSYDVNVSGFKIATLRRGGPELSLRYIFSKPTPLFKTCPLI